MKRILITGGAGFIGTHLAERLSNDYELILLDNFRRDSLSKIPSLREHTNVRVMTADVLDPASLAPAVEGADIILHLAAIAGVSSYYTESLRTLQVNILGTVNLLELAAKYKVGRWVHFSTSEVFGPDAMFVDEESGFRIGPVSDRRWVYATSKLAGEQFSLRFGEQHGFASTVVRPFNIYGPRQTGEGAISNFCRAAVEEKPITVYGDGTPLRAWCYVSDMVDAVDAILRTPESAGQAFNIGNPSEVASTLDLARRVARLKPTSIERKEVTRAEVRARVPVIDKAKKILGFDPKIDLDEGLRRTLAWFESGARVKVAVVGAGKMGLPLACQFAHNGATVLACDIDPDLVATINRGEAPFEEPGLLERLAPAVAAGRLRATTDTEGAARECDVVVVIVPAFLTPERDVDASILQAVATVLARSLKKGALIGFETTLPVGGTRRLLLPFLEREGKKAGVDFDLAFSPERVKSQSVFRNLTVNPKVVGGLSPETAERAAAFYREFLDAPVMNVGTLEAAEMVKLAGMVYRDVNIALANELARYGEAVGVDVDALKPAINCDGEAALLSPGIGVGGHCTPLYPYFLIRDAERRGTHATLAERSRAINDGQAAHAIDRLERAWGPVRDRRVLILGLAFRPEVKEDMLSSAYLLDDTLRARGAAVTLHDPLFSDEEIRRHGFEAGHLDDAPEVVVLQTAHAAYRAIDLAALARRGVAAIVDGRNLWDAESARRAGLIYVGIGRPIPGPDRPEPIPIARPLLGGAEAEAAAQVIRSGWVLQGPEVAALERELAAFVDAPHACAVSSGTAALHLGLLAVGVGPGDEVITVSHSYVATANSVKLCGATPVFVDVDDTYNLDPAQLEAALSSRTRAILCVHQMGMPCDLGRILAMAAQARLPVIEDAACAIGSEIMWHDAWQRIGRPHGTLATFSFHPRKLLTTGDGGMVTTRDPAIDRKVRLLRQHGMLRSDGAAEVVGFNYRLTDIQGAVGRQQLRRLPAMLSERRQQAERYRALLSDLPVELPHEPSWARSNWQSYCVRLSPGADRDGILRALAGRNISARGGIMNAHQQPAYSSQSGAHLPASEAATSHGLILPLYPGMTAAEQQCVADALRNTMRPGAR